MRRYTTKDPYHSDLKSLDPILEKTLVQSDPFILIEPQIAP